MASGVTPAARPGLPQLSPGAIASAGKRSGPRKRYAARNAANAGSSNPGHTARRPVPRPPPSSFHAPSATLPPSEGYGRQHEAVRIGVVERAQLRDRRRRNPVAVLDEHRAVLEVVDQSRLLHRLVVRAVDERLAVVRPAGRGIRVPVACSPRRATGRRSGRRRSRALRPRSASTRPPRARPARRRARRTRAGRRSRRGAPSPRARRSPSPRSGRASSARCPLRRGLARVAASAPCAGS